ncbi:MAG: alpha-amylase family glycosyl hydrolase [Promethearchaeota archaeon]
MPFKDIKWPRNPKIYEINTWPWLHSLSEHYNYSITLKNIPEEVFDQELSLFDAVWLMGVWERSPASKRIAFEHPDLQTEYHRALSDFRDEDVIGSPYSVYYYHVDKHIGGIEGLTEIRKQLFERGIRLMLDYVPNHVSIDSLWTLEKNLFIKGTVEDLISHANDFFSISDNVYAHGKDPNFPAWTDTIQINAFSKEAREKTVKTLLQIAMLCDGVRCDMAMLTTNDVFENTWGEKAGPKPEKEFWEEIIPKVKKEFPHFIFIAEVYWDMEWALQQQGFDFCYDKRLYERLLHGNVQSIKAHLNAEWDYQSKLVRFMENHDEQRAISLFGEERSRAAAIITLTLPGAKLIHEGQMCGYKIKLPVQLGRRESEEINKSLLDFYRNLLKIVPSKGFRKENWEICEVKPIEISDHSFNNIISYYWGNNSLNIAIVVNYSPNPAKAHIKINKLNYGSNNWKFSDLLTQKEYVYKGNDLNKYGLYVDLSAWNGHIFEIKRML